MTGLANIFDFGQTVAAPETLVSAFRRKRFTRAAVATLAMASSGTKVEAIPTARVIPEEVEH